MIIGVTHRVDDPGVVWYGGTGHKLLGMDGGGVQCYRCGMAAEPDVEQEAIPDCQGPTGGGDHHWQAAANGIECAYGDALSAANGEQFTYRVNEPCKRA